MFIVYVIGDFAIEVINGYVKLALINIGEDYKI